MREQSVGRRFRWSLLNSMSGLTMSIVTFLAISRVVDPGEYGRCSVIMAIWGLLGNAIDWCGVLLMRFGPVELHAEGSLRRTLSTRLVFAAPAAPLLLAAPVYLGLARGWAPGLLGLTVVWIVSWTGYDLLRWCGVAAQRFRALTLSSVLFKGAPLAVVLGARQLHLPVRAEALLISTVLGTALACGVLALTLQGLVGLERPDRALLREMWRYSLPSLIGVPALAVISYLDPLLLNQWATKADIGRYQLALPTITIFSALGSSFNSVFSPELVQRSAQKDDRAIDRYRLHDQPLLAVLLALGGFGGACIAAPIVRALLPASYALTADLVALLSVAGGFLLAFWTLHPLVTPTNNVWSQQLASMLQSSTHLGFALLLAPRFGSTGIAVASTCGWSVAFVSLSLLMRRRIGARLVAVAPVCAVGAVTAALVALQVRLAVRVPIGVALLGVAGAGALQALRARRSR